VRALVTGGAGFIGHHLVKALLARGDEVSVIDDYSTGMRVRLDGVRERIRLVEASILDEAALRDAVDGVEVIFHEAAIPSVARSIVDPLLTNEVNVTGTIRVMQAAERARVRRVVFAGSSSIYGVPESLPCSESFQPRPMSPYGVSKLAGEHYIRAMGELHGIDTVTLRYFNVFGPGQDPASEYAAVIPRFVTSVLAGRRPQVYGTGEVSRDFTYVDNVVTANLLAARPEAPTGLVCNVACGDRHTLLELLESIGRAARRPVDAEFGPARAGDIIHSLADIRLATSELGYSVTVPFDVGIVRTVEWYRDAAEASVP
jgi:UDP-glucose 4-epimerase